MSQFIDALTSETWGLTITLPDFPVTLIPDDQKRDAKKNELHADYKELYVCLSSRDELECFIDNHFAFVQNKAASESARVLGDAQRPPSANLWLCSSFIRCHKKEGTEVSGQNKGEEGGAGYIG